MLELKNVSFGVNTEEGEKEIIRDVSMTVEDNQFLVITGPNGGGKSTLARLIVGIEKPDSGKILFNGEDITDRSVTERARMGISFAFQQPVKFKGIQVIDLLRIASGKQLTVSEACEYLSEVGLCARDYIEREVNSSLSGGEMKRIEIATVIARDTKLSVFDEPEAGIDLWSFKNLIQVFVRMQSRNKGSIIIISHQERILNIADKIVVINSGRVEKSGPKDEILPSLLGTSSAVNACQQLERGGGASDAGRDTEKTSEGGCGSGQAPGWSLQHPCKRKGGSKKFHRPY